MRSLRHDFTHAVRRLWRTPLYTVFAAFTLAVGIAATTSVFALLYSVVWRPDAISSPDRVVELKGGAVSAGRGESGRFSWPDWQTLIEQQRSFSQMAAIQRVPTSIVHQGLASMAIGEGVTSGYFEMVGVPALQGRVLTNSDSAPDAPLVVVLSARLSIRLFINEAEAVGQNLKIGGQTAVVVGVVADNFYGMNSALAASAFWMPLEHCLKLTPAPWGSFDAARRDMRWLTARGRLRDSVNLAGATEDVSLIGQRLDESFPSVAVAWGVQAGTHLGRQWRAEPVNMREIQLFSAMGAAVMGGVILVMLMVCANLANLGLARSASRRSEFEVRRALGASRWRLVREQLVECTLVVAVGGLLAAWATRWLVTLMDTDLRISTSMTMMLQPKVTLPVVAVAGGVSLLSIILVGLWPALRHSGAHLNSFTGQDGAPTAPKWRTIRWLVAAQVAGSVALLLLAVSMAKSVTHGTEAPGVDVNRIAVATLNFYLSPRDPIQINRLREDVLERVRRMPGVEEVAASVSLPFGVRSSQGRLAMNDFELVGGRDGGHSAYLISGTAGLFPALGIRMVSGRAFSEDEIRNRRAVTVLSQTTAQDIFGTGEAIGRLVWLRRSSRSTDVPQALTVVGVSRDTDTFVMGLRPSGAAYFPFDPQQAEQMVFVARTGGDAGLLAGELHRAIREVDPVVVVDMFGTGWAMLSGRYFFFGALAWVASTLGMLTLILVMTGLFGVLSTLVSQQRREFAIRMTLGCTSTELLRFVIMQGLRPARDGLIIGLVVGVLSRLALRAILPSGLAVVDVFAFALVPLVIAVTVVVSSILPARRAASVDPNVALREL